MIKILLGGSPCTHWSVAQKNNRETQPNSGLGWELFLNYKIALDKYKPDYFLYENNKSAARPIKDEIARVLQVTEPNLITPDNGIRMTHINSALVSAQQRERFYVTNFGDIFQPDDRGILLRDVLDGMTDRDKARTVLSSVGRTTTREYFQKSQNTMAFEPCCVGCYPSPDGSIKNSQGMRLYGVDGKSVNMTAQGGGLGAKTGLYAIPVNATANGDKARTLMSGYYKYGTATLLTNEGFKGGTTAVAEPIGVGKSLEQGIEEIVKKHGYLPEMFNAYNRSIITDKAPTLSTGSMVTSSCAVNRFENIDGYAIPIEWDEDGRPTKAVSGADGKVYRVYEVKNGLITIKGKQYPIDLPDGFYIIRKLTVSECKRLQTIPDWYEFPVSDSQAYKMIGNGWTIEVIKYLLSHIPNILNEEIEVLSMYDGMSCGQIALKEMGCNVVKYYATEIDKYAIKTTLHNFPNTIQLGDAFQVREEGWHL